MSVQDFLSDKARKLYDKLKPGEISIGGFVAGVRIRDNIHFGSSIPEATLEDGSIVQDHIINNPVDITVTGLLGDIDLKPSPAIDFFIRGNQKAGVITKYLPERTQAQVSKVNSLALSARDIYLKADQMIKDGMEIFQLFKPSESKPLYQQFFDAILQVRNTKQLIRVETTYGVFENMAVEDVMITQEHARSKGFDYSIRFKEIRFAETIYSPVDSLASNPSSAINGQAQAQVEKGLQAGSSVKESALSKILGVF
jgi:hypothetical protein